MKKLMKAIHDHHWWCRENPHYAEMMNECRMETLDSPERYWIADFIDFVGYSVVRWFAIQYCKRYGHSMEIEEYMGNDTAGADFYCERCGYHGRHIYF